MFGRDEMREYYQDSGVSDVFFYSFPTFYHSVHHFMSLCAFRLLFLTERERRREKNTLSGLPMV